jgi:hypothetical protein
MRNTVSTPFVRKIALVALSPDDDDNREDTDRNSTDVFQHPKFSNSSERWVDQMTDFKSSVAYLSTVSDFKAIIPIRKSPIPQTSRVINTVTVVETVIDLTM